MFSILNILWLFRAAKHILFWLYLWQLKDYHIPRIVDHFRTHNGRKIILSPLLFAKFILLAVLLINELFFNFVFAALFVIYVFESIIFARAISLKQVKKPVATPKILLLGAILFFVTLALFWSSSLKLLLFFDIFTPIIVSAVTLAVQPIFVFIRGRILAKTAQKLKKFKNLKVIAITGSYGKTSTKEFLTTILSQKFNVISTRENQNSEIGIANCVLNDLDESHEVFIAEIGAYDKGKVDEVCSMIKPKIGIVTGVNEQHLALFGSMENLLSAEGGRDLAAALPKDGFLLLNGDNKYCLDLYKTDSAAAKKIYATAKSIDANIWAEDIEAGKESVSFVAIDKEREVAHFKASVLGRHNVQNLLGAILASRELGMSFEEISDGCKNIKTEQAGMVLGRGKHGLIIIDSSYSANPDGVFADLDYLNIFSNKKAVIMPCLIELGLKSAEIHQKIGRKIAETCSFAVITTKDSLEDIRKGAVEGGMSSKNIMFFQNPEEILAAVTMNCKSGDAILFEGRVPAGLIKILSE